MSEQSKAERMLGVLLLSSLIAGLVAGICARIVMRIVALTAHVPLSFTAGTLNVVLIGFFIGFIAGFMYTIFIVGLSSSTKIRKYLPGPIWRGLLFGVLLLLIFGPPNLLGSSSPTDEINLGIPLLNKCMFAALPLIYGITLGVAEKILERYLPPKQVSLKTETSSSQVQEE